MILKKVKIGLVFLFTLIYCDLKAQSKKDINYVINYVIDTLLLKNPGQILTIGSLTKPYILNSTTLRARPGQNVYDYTITTFSEYKRLEDTVELKRQISTDISTVMSCKKNIILSAYLPQDSLFNARSQGLFEKIYLTNPIFFNKGKYCIVSIGSNSGGQILLMKRNVSKWTLDKSIAYWMY